MRRSLWLALALAVLCGLAVTSAVGQAVYGSILGTVSDPSGAAVNGAKVTATSQTKNVSVEATTNESGNYAITHLIPDVYTVRVEAQGFKVLEFKDVQVSADTGSRVDGQFQVGGASETVEVTSEASQLKTDRADVAIEFNSKQLAELPIYNRNFQSLELLTPGTQLLGWSHAATENPQGSKQVYVNGQHFSGTGYELDGTDNQDPILGIIIVNPSLDAVTETKMTTQNYDAEFGKALAGIMTAQTKSGTNEFHGSGYFYDLDPVDPAVNPFTGKASPNNWKQFGGAVGGPVIKNKLFFFGDYEATRRSSGTTFLTTVPTSLVRSTCLTAGSANCNLSEYLGNASLGSGQVYNPYGPAGGRKLYAGNIIPQGDLQLADAASAGCAPNCTTLTTSEKILALLPAPNAAGDHNGTLNNYSASGSGSFNDYQYVGRVDYTATQKLQIFGRYTHANFKLSGKPVFGNAIGGPGLGYLGLGGQSLISNYSLASGFNYTVSSTLLTDFRFGYFRYNPHSTKFDQSSTNAAANLGLPGLNTSDVTTNGLPGFFFDAIPAGGGGFGSIGEALNITRCNCPLIEKEQGEQYVNNWTKIWGNHQFKVGADLRHATNLRVPSDANRTGQMHFSWLGTSDGIGVGGVDLATYLFSEVSNMDRYVGSATEPNAMEIQNRYFFYAQDTWRATHKLTVNYGLRWEHYTPEKVNGKGNGGFAVLPEGVIRVAGFGSNSLNGSTAADYKNFAPRIGIAYEATPKTVVRMGYGRSFDIGVFGSLFGHTVTQNLPVLAHQTLNSRTFDNKTAAYNFTGQCLPAAGGYDPAICGPQSGTAAFPIIPSNGILPLFGPCPEGSNPCQGNVQPKSRPDHFVLPTVDAWNVTVQRQLTNSTSLEVAYVANHGSHVFKGGGPSYNSNQATIVGCAGPGCSTGLTYAQRSPYNTAFSTPYTYADGTTVNVLCCEGNGFDYRGNDGTNSYKALQLTLNQRASQGLTLMAHYTYSRAYDNDGSYQPDLSQGHGRNDWNRDSVFVLTSVYELPFGRGKKYLGGISRATNLLLGGWQWNATMTIGSGLPWSPNYSECNSDRDTGPCRPNLAGSFHMGSGSFNNQTRQVVFFTPVAPLATNGAVSGAFSRPAIATFGNIHRNQFTGPGEFFSDMSIFKNFTVTEKVNAQFQAEFFNAFNHPVYALPNNCIDCSSGGLITGLDSASLMRQLQFGVRVTF